MPSKPATEKLPMAESDNEVLTLLKQILDENQKGASLWEKLGVTMGAISLGLTLAGGVYIMGSQAQVIRANTKAIESLDRKLEGQTYLRKETWEESRDATNRRLHALEKSLRIRNNEE